MDPFFEPHGITISASSLDGRTFIRHGQISLLGASALSNEHDSQSYLHAIDSKCSRAFLNGWKESASGVMARSLLHFNSGTCIGNIKTSYWYYHTTLLQL
jgi:hypothetical protein